MTKSNYNDIFTSQDVISSPGRLDYIPWDTVKEKLGDEYEQFMEWMRGQSCTSDGAFASDVRNYFYRRDRGQLDGLPHGY